jgi:putative adhesin
MTRRPTFPIVVLLAAGVALPAGAQVHTGQLLAALHAPDGQQRQQRNRSRDQDREEQTERTTRTLRLGGSGELDLANIAGDITVTRGTGQDATIEIVKTARAPSADEAKDALGLVQVDVTERGGRAEVHTRYPNDDERRGQNRRNLNVQVTYTVAAPAGARITAHSISGSISVRDIRGELSLESVSGNVSIAGGGRVSTAKTVSGNVEIAGTDLDGALDASSVSGNVTLRKSKARRLALTTISGNVEIDDVECPRLEAKSVSGTVQLSGSLTSDGRYDLTSHSGDIRIAVSGDTGFELEANSFSGSIRSDLPLSGQNGSGRRDLTMTDRGGRRQRAVQGVYGNGSAVLDVTTFSGSVIISKR